MKRACFVRLFQLLTTTFLLSQSNPVPVINQTANVVPPASAVQPDPKAQARILDQYGKLPLGFEANQGRADERVKFLSRTGAYSLFLTADEAVLALRGKQARKGKATASAVPFNAKRMRALAHGEATQGTSANRDDEATEGTANSILRMKLRNANSAAKVNGLDELTGTSNYFVGNDPTKWRTNVPTYAKVKYEGIYPGIDLVYYGNQRQLEYDFIVAPGADRSRIAFEVSGAKRIRQDAHGDLVFKMGEGEIRWKEPVVYQEKNGARQLVAARYAVTETNRVTFDLAKYDASRPLYIDPLIYSTYLGGSGNDQGNGIAVDSAGNAYVTGYTESTDFPSQSPFQSSNGGSTTAFVTKINAAGSALVYSTYLGGSGGDTGYGIVVDSAGNAYVVGQTASTDFPTKNPLQPSLGGAADAFVAKLNSTGSALVYSTYLGGSGEEFGLGIALDGAANAYVTGTTASTNFPITAGAFQTSCAGSSCGDAFVSKLNSTGSALIYSTYLGGSGEDVGQSIAVDTDGHAYVTGYTSSTDFPTKNPLQGSCSGQYDIFVTKFNPKGSSLIYSTYLGGPENDFGNGIAADSKGDAYVTGVNYTNFCNRVSCYYNAFVTEIDPTGSAFVYDVGSDTNYSAGNGIAVDSSGNAYVIGATGGDSETPVYTTFVEKFDPSGSAVGSPTYLRGGSGSFGYGIATDGLDNAYVTGTTRSTNFPTRSPLQPANAGGYDAFVTKIDMRIVTATTLTSSPNPSTQGQAITFTVAITSSDGTPPDGETVSFMKGKTVLGTGLLSGGSANFTTSTLPVGTNVVTAVYAGDSNFAGSTSKAVKQVVNEAAMPDLVSSENPSTSGQSLASTASVAHPVGGTLEADRSKVRPQDEYGLCRTTTKALVYGSSYVTQPVTIYAALNMSEGCDDQIFNYYFCAGTVAFYDYIGGHKNFLGNGSQVPPNACYLAFTTSSLTAGSHLIVAEFEGNPDYARSSGSVTVGISTWPTTTTVTSSADPSNYGQDVTFTVAPTSEIEDPQTGKVTIYNGTIPFGTATLNGNGVATFTVRNLAVGTNAITAEYLGDSLSAKSTSAVLNQVVNPASTVTGITSSANPSSPGETVTFAAGVVSSTGAIPSGTVTFAVGGTTLGTVALSGKIAKISTATLPAGSTTITATYNRSTGFTGSSASLTQTVRQ